MSPPVVVAKTDRLAFDRLLEDKGMSLGELSRATGLSLSTVSRIRSGQRTPRLDTLGVMATALRVEMAILLRIVFPQKAA